MSPVNHWENVAQQIFRGWTAGVSTTYDKPDSGLVTRRNHSTWARWLFQPELRPWFWIRSLPPVNLGLFIGKMGG